MKESFYIDLWHFDARLKKIEKRRGKLALNLIWKIIELLSYTFFMQGVHHPT